MPTRASATRDGALVTYPIPGSKGGDVDEWRPLWLNAEHTDEKEGFSADEAGDEDEEDEEDDDEDDD